MCICPFALHMEFSVFFLPRENIRINYELLSFYCCLCLLFGRCDFSMLLENLIRNCAFKYIFADIFILQVLVLYFSTCHTNEERGNVSAARLFSPVLQCCNGKLERQNDSQCLLVASAFVTPRNCHAFVATSKDSSTL